MQLSDGINFGKYTVCYDDWDAAWSNGMCSELGHQPIAKTRLVPISQLKGPWVKLENLVNKEQITLKEFTKVSKCKSPYALALKCQTRGKLFDM